MRTSEPGTLIFWNSHLRKAFSRLTFTAGLQGGYLQARKVGSMGHIGASAADVP